MVTSCVGAWRQTGASALLIAAAVAALYGLVHLFDMRQPKPAEAVEPQRIDFEPETADVIVPMVSVLEQPVVEDAVEPAEAVEAAVPRAGAGRRTGGSRKTSGRRVKAPKAAKVVKLTAVEDSAAEEEEFAFAADDDAAQPHIAPLFEPEPFARMPRRAFGRRGQL